MQCLGNLIKADFHKVVILDHFSQTASFWENGLFFLNPSLHHLLQFDNLGDSSLQN